VLSLELERSFLAVTKKGLRYFPEGQREILLAKIMRDSKMLAIGEWAPLYSVHKFGIDEIFIQEKELKYESLEYIFSSSFGSFKQASRLFKNIPYPLSFLLSTAHFALSQSHKQVKKGIKQSMLVLAEGLEETLGEARSLLSQNYDCLKVKIGRLAISHEIERIKALKKLMGPRRLLRLDANRAYSMEDAQSLLSAFNKDDIDYVEEPLKESSRLLELSLRTQIPIALDESFTSIEELLHWQEEGLRVLIIKASRFHSIYDAAVLAERALELKLRPIFSSCFESDRTFFFMAHLINALGLEEDFHGLGHQGCLEIAS
jgi:o-succinylbenzoate synthase